MPEGPQTVAHIRVAIRDFCGPVDSGRRRDREGRKDEVRDEGEESRSRGVPRSVNRVQGYTNEYGRVIPSARTMFLSWIVPKLCPLSKIYGCKKTRKHINLIRQVY